MRRFQRYAWGALAALLWAGPAAAQEPEWAHDLARQIEQQVERHVQLMARQIERVVEQHAEHQVLAKKIKVVFEQAGRQAGQAARRAAQEARTAERRRREEARRGPEYTEQITRTLRLGRNGVFDLQNLSGDIVVTGGGGNEVRLEATKRVRHPNESEAKAMLRAIEIRVDERNGNVEVRTDYPRRNWAGGVDYTVSVPRDANVVLRSVAGDIRVTTLNGELRAESVSGNVQITSAQRVRQAKSMSGDLEIADSDGDEVAGGTVSGDVIARGLKARTVDLQSVSGDLRLTDVESDRAFVRTVSGNVDFSGRLARNGRYEFKSHSGDVRVSPLSSQGFSVAASTFSGDLRSDYPLTLEGNSNGFGPRRGNRGIRGSFGDGGTALSMESFSGNITIVKR
jgi:DUF4097 and DUF4098 domain-containing protein YvlB